MGWLAEVWSWLLAFVGWFDEWRFVNLVLPTMLPICVLLIPRFISRNPLASPWVSVKDGQLAWAALGMCTAAFYDFRHPSAGVKLRPEWEHLNFWILLISTGFSSVFAALAPLSPTGTTRPPGVWAGIQHFRVFFGSVLLTICVAYLYAQVHLTTQTT